MHRPFDVDAVRRNIHDLLHKRSRSERWLAHEAGISQPTLNRFLNGETATMTAESYMLLAHALEVTLSELLGEVPLSSSVAARDVMRCMAQMDEPTRAELAEIGATLSRRTKV